MTAIGPILTTAAALAAPVSAVPVSSARVEFDTRRIDKIRVTGVADKTSARALTPDDSVRVASVSKLVVAMGVMRMAESGALDLDRDVSTYLGWTLRNPTYPDVPLTLRMLLSHTSSLRDDADYAVPLGDSVRARVGNARAWDVDHRPGGWFRYSNLNFPVVASIMETVTGERFDKLMTRVVFTPLKLDACFNWPMCSDAKLARKVVLYDIGGPVRTDGFATLRPECPVNLPVNTGAGCDLAA